MHSTLLQFTANILYLIMYSFHCFNTGLDGCFIKLSTGQQILAATGRDGNNNIFPIVIGIVDKEDKDSWTWFLSQLRACIGEGNRWGTYTIIFDRQKVYFSFQN